MSFKCFIDQGLAEVAGIQIIGINNSIYMWYTYIIIAILLVAAELAYFKIADKCNIIDKPNERSSHSTIVLRGGGIIFAISMIIWFLWQCLSGNPVNEYIPFIIGLVLICGVSFWDDVHSLPDSTRLLVQFLATAIMLFPLLSGTAVADLGWGWKALIGLIALIVFVGATDVINFMDGINGITAGYALAVLIPLLLLDKMPAGGFIADSYLVVAILGILVFSFFNFRPQSASPETWAVLASPSSCSLPSDG